MNLRDGYTEWRENNRLEFKRAQGGFPRSFWETYSAFANTEGGLVVFGVDETPDGPKVVGVKDADALVRNLWNGLNDRQRVSVNLLVDSDVSVEDAGGVTVVSVRVPRAERSQRPVYINNSMNTGTYRRNGEGDYRCGMEIIGAMVRDGADGALDKEPLAAVGLDALNPESVRSYRREFSRVRVTHPWGSLQDEEFLLRIGAIGRSREDGMLHPTKAGLLMLGEAWRITDAFPNYFLDCRQASGVRRWDNRITSDSGEWSGNVYDFWNRASLMLCEGLPVPFGLGPGMVRVDDTPQHEAVREGLTNALVHADYYGRTGVVAVRRPSSIEFSNPGCLRLPAEVVEGGGVSDPRNKTLMTMFNLIGRGDKAGSGFDVFRRAAEYARVEGPEIEEAFEPDRTKLILHVQTDGTKIGAIDVVNVGDIVNVVNRNDVDVANIETLDVVNVANGNGCNAVRSRDLEDAVLLCVRNDARASAAAIAEALGLSARQAQRYLKQLREKGRIERVGGTRGHWEVKG